MATLEGSTIMRVGTSDLGWRKSTTSATAYLLAVKAAGASADQEIMNEELLVLRRSSVSGCTISAKCKIK